MSRLVVTTFGGACPTQAEGVLPDGSAFYFRARHGRWTIEAGPDGPKDYLDWPRDSGRLIANDEFEGDGYMSRPEFDELMAHLGLAGEADA